MEPQVTKAVSTSACDNSMEHQKSQADDLRSSFGEYNTDQSQTSKTIHRLTQKDEET